VRPNGQWQAEAQTGCEPNNEEHYDHQNYNHCGPLPFNEEIMLESTQDVNGELKLTQQESSIPEILIDALERWAIQYERWNQGKGNYPSSAEIIKVIKELSCPFA
jgi:hypothetical protein